MTLRGNGKARMSKAKMEVESAHINSDEREDSEDFADSALFQEPDGYFRPEKPPSFVEHTLLSGEKLYMRLVGHNSLWVRPACSMINQQLMLRIGPSSMEWSPGCI